MSEAIPKIGSVCPWCRAGVAVHGRYLATLTADMIADQAIGDFSLSPLVDGLKAHALVVMHCGQCGGRSFKIKGGAIDGALWPINGRALLDDGGVIDFLVPGVWWRYSNRTGQTVDSYRESPSAAGDMLELALSAQMQAR